MTFRYPGGLEDSERFRELVNLFESKEQRNYYYERALETVNEEFDENWYVSDELVLGGPMLLMYTWNFAARETKSMDKEEIKDIFERFHEDIEEVRETSLTEANLYEGGATYQTIQTVWEEMKEYFGQTGTSKVLSLLSPELFVMWDQDIRTRRKKQKSDPSGTKREDRGVYFYMEEQGYSTNNNSTEFGRDADDYVLFLRYCKEIIEETSNSVFDEKEAPPAKLIDEALYSFYKIENG